jgi:RNA polymerase sigma-70 factor (ECF subfamily)
LRSYANAEIKDRDPETVDSVLVSRGLNGDQDAFEALVNRYKQSLFGLLYLPLCWGYQETEDILQQAWLQLYRSLASLHPNLQIKPWLSTVARNRSLDFLRHKHVLSKRQFFFSEVQAIPDTGPTSEELAELQELRREIQLAIQSLPHTCCPVV